MDKPLELKRSKINSCIDAALETCAYFNFKLPPFAYWKVEEWKKKNGDFSEISSVCDDLKDNVFLRENASDFQPSWEISPKSIIYAMNTFPKTSHSQSIPKNP